MKRAADFGLSGVSRRARNSPTVSAICKRLPVWLSDWQTSANPETTPPGN